MILLSRLTLSTGCILMSTAIRLKTKEVGAEECLVRRLAWVQILKMILINSLTQELRKDELRKLPGTNVSRLSRS
ncbi:hypothetical protein BH23CYA1_BH23CYA1_08500 [soil metagenome]